MKVSLDSFSDCSLINVYKVWGWGPEGDVAEVEGEAAPASVPEGGEGPVTTPPTDTQPAEITASSPPAEMATVSDKELNSKRHQK